MRKSTVVALVLLALTTSAEARGRGRGGCCSFVRGYVRSNGTYVHSYFRASPGAGRYRTYGTPSFPGPAQPGGVPSAPYRSNDDVVGAPIQEVREAVAGPHPDCAGHKMYGTGYGVCVEGGQLEE